MIQINDCTTPIEVAQKIINGTEEVEANIVDKAVMRTFGYEEKDTMCRNMFSLEEIKEIAGYLLVYCNAHRSQEEE